MKESKRILGLSVDIGVGPTDGIRKLEIRVREFIVHNAAEELQESIALGNESQQHNNLHCANVVQRAAGETRYFTHTSFAPDLTFVWQDDPDSRDRWYAGRRSIVIPERIEWVGVNLLERDDGLPARKETAQ